MANYSVAESITGRNEGGYANSSKDRGGETMYGIARKFWPTAKIWPFVDKYKAQYPGLAPALKKKFTLAGWINASARADNLPLLVSQFYKLYFWNPNNLDLFKDQALANSVYDFGVNSGLEHAADLLQDAYNNVRPKGAPALKNDSDIGPTTLKAIHSIDPVVLYNEYSKLRGNFYRSIAKGDQAGWLNGWLARIKKYIKY